MSTEYVRTDRDYISAIISQLVYSAGGSGFAGANGSMMIEVVVSTSSLILSVRSLLMLC